MADNFIKQRANAQFKNPPAIDSGKPVMSESEAAADALAAKIARLKELRLARDAAELAAPPQPVPVKKKVRSKKKRAPAAPAASLSDWLKDRHAGGHNS
jgi:phage terminase large subunit-like protein